MVYLLLLLRIHFAWLQRHRTGREGKLAYATINKRVTSFVLAWPAEFGFEYPNAAKIELSLSRKRDIYRNITHSGGA